MVRSLGTLSRDRAAGAAFAIVHADGWIRIESMKTVPQEEETMSQPSKVAIVTGAARGIGRAIASRLGRGGFAVVVNYVSKPGEAEEVVKDITAAGGKALAIQADVSKPEDVIRLFEETGKQLGGVDVLVNNAGIMDLKTIGEASDEVFERTFAVNVRGTFNTM